MKIEFDKKHIGIRIWFNKPLRILNKEINGYALVLIKPKELPWYNWFIPYVKRVKIQRKS